jgi:hypothetical protein
LVMKSMGDGGKLEVELHSSGIADDPDNMGVLFLCVSLVPLGK